MIKEILLIDDDPIINFINSKIITNEWPEMPFKIFTNGLSALEYIGTNCRTSFLIFLDINMPVMDAWEFLEALPERQDKFDLQIHILTSSVDKVDEAKANQYKDVYSFIHKPLKRTKLVEINKNII